MDSLQIKKILSENRGTGQVFRGCFASDQLPPPSALQYPAALVVNRDSHYKEGSHWCAIYARGMEAPALYYDSLAQPIPPAVTSSFLCEFQGAGTSSSTSKTAKDYVRKLDSTIEHVPRFQYSKAKSRFSIEDVPAAANPEGLLAGIFQYSIDAAVADSRERGIHPTHLGCLISSQLLTGGDIPIPIRQITDNTVNTILNQFVKVAQSKKQQNVTLWGEPFTVVVTTVNRPGLPTKRTLKGGQNNDKSTVLMRWFKINNPDERNYCLFYALQSTMVAKSRGWASWKFLDYVHSRHGQQGCLQRDALQLMQQIGARPGLNANDIVLQCLFLVRLANTKPLYKYINNYYDTPIALYLNNGHFDGVKKEYGLFGQHYCLECEKPYERPSRHLISCKARCMLCSRVGPRFPCSPVDGFFRECAGCNKAFRNNDCHQHHLTSNFCAQSKRCKECGVHKCDERYCQTCNNFHNMERGCYIQQIEPKENDPYRIVAFDLETMQHHAMDPQQPDKREHQPNFIAARRRFMDTQVDKQVVADNPLEPFVNWLVFELPKKCDTYAYSHFGGRFDMLRSSLLMVWTWRTKPFFPHLANRPENYGREIRPTPDDYLANGMMPGKRRQFDEWYAAHHQEPFMLDEALASYCTNDVEILMAALVAFRREFFEISRRQEYVDGIDDRENHDGIDVLRECMTIAGACMRHFRTNHLPNDHLAIVPERGYDNAQNQSLLALRFFHWYSEEYGVDVQTAHSAGGEKRIGPYSVDGWIEAEGRAIEAVLGMDARNVIQSITCCCPTERQRGRYGSATQSGWNTSGPE
ncbi:hypothetical protein niasHT_028319 [Heterodera trifolii]|uniref:DNA-directed DNA polymerase n=1 Tax=Heterodera trifolii TaxID=157864 RepID=A0ABD2JN19_9BILA